MNVRIKILSLLILAFLGANAQSKVETIKVKKELTDTLDYTYMLRFEGWSLVKVLDNKVRSLYNCNKNLWFSNRLDSSTILKARLQQPPLKINDTIVSIYWYINNGCVTERCGHDDYFWRMKLNRNNNIMIMDRLFCPQDTKLVKLLFKVIKFSQFEIILEDMQVKSVKRRYYFQKNVIK